MIGNDIKYAAELLLAGEVVAIPTETVYGLAADACNTTAVAQIFAIKNRPAYNPLIVHVPSVHEIMPLVQNLPEAAALLLERFSPGPLTVLLPRNSKIPDIVTAGLPNVAVRIPNHPVALSLLRTAGIPLAAPSANPFGYISPTAAHHVEHMLGDKIKYILDGGRCAAGIESTIIGFPDGVPTMYREGALARSAIEQVIGPVVAHNAARPQAPGMLARHYQPHTPVWLTARPSEVIASLTGKSVGLITYNSYSTLLEKTRQILLCTESNFSEAAHNLYAAMHQM
ncbi:MAG: threonylcarbamoyl-AMP synthase, partial [Chitinophagia bacterium]|nr:threonylcarbamoyl-AMP synthase [Chitinophagia bacterium]